MQDLHLLHNSASTMIPYIAGLSRLSTQNWIESRSVRRSANLLLVPEEGFEPSSSRLWASRATAAPLWDIAARQYGERPGRQIKRIREV